MKTSDCAQRLADNIITKPKVFNGRDLTAFYFSLHLEGIAEICSFYGYTLKQRRELIQNLTEMIITRNFEKNSIKNK